ncbi:hypothetical protein [Oceanisphaera arctica]|uniref:Molecular chaperone DnaJ n=1 Tax=Oceanisphaera arctica TaxID=641510 RepID=A0A2P5TPD3_9GAMM|nr:hypothetical protein [Oceanisphaera arctica]PPL17540.1 hypothetical protein UN63_04425 [Oceanisphaera arctica]GHA16416.1 hypothetical protein GCM10007082_16490 [Oceanisphaera arctica]
MTKLTTTKPTKKTPGDQFQLLWEKIEKQKTRLAGQEKRVRKIVDRFNDEILPLERKQARTQYQLIERLLTFFSRKSLTQWQRDDLFRWIQDELGMLSTNPFIEDGLNPSELLIRAEELLKQFYPQPEAPALSQSEREDIRGDIYRELGLEIDDEEVELFLNSPTEFMQRMMEKMQADDLDWPEEEDDEEQGDRFDTKDAKSVDGQAEGKALIHRLYKQLAKRLHPDLEQDASLKAVRHEQMQQLLAARKENDIYTLIELHRQHFDTDALGQLKKQDLDDINELLRRQLRDLERQYEQVFMKDSMESTIWNRFRHVGRISSDQNFAEHTKALKADIKNNNKLLKHLKTLKDLKQFLEDRIYG